LKVIGRDDYNEMARQGQNARPDPFTFLHLLTPSPKHLDEQKTAYLNRAIPLQDQTPPYRNPTARHTKSRWSELQIEYCRGAIRGRRSCSLPVDL